MGDDWRPCLGVCENEIEFHCQPIVVVVQYIPAVSKQKHQNDAVDYNDDDDDDDE